MVSQEYHAILFSLILKFALVLNYIKADNYCILLILFLISKKYNSFSGISRNVLFLESVLSTLKFVLSVKLHKSR